MTSTQLLKKIKHWSAIT